MQIFGSPAVSGTPQTLDSLNLGDCFYYEGSSGGSTLWIMGGRMGTTTGWGCTQLGAFGPAGPLQNLDASTMVIKQPSTCVVAPPNVG
jgi:hypothetical protein